ncbi:MAG: tetratricopeptide repeat protein [Candidatus Lindowbacteria bacterium]|nr:tetratricopeptide repeat protein [Candidatus Lindowbacteria bacterium]
MKSGRGTACITARGFAVALLLLPIFSAPAHSQTPTLSSSPIVTAEQANGVFDIANEEYKAGNIESAIRLYENLLSNPTLRKADICYNLGNAYFKLNKYGKAIAAYRHALSLAPRDQDIRANLSLVRNLTRDKIDQPRNTELFREIFFFHYDINHLEAETIFLIGYISAAALGTLHLFYRKKTVRILAYISLVVTLAFGFSAFVHARGSASPSNAVVVVDTADARTGPGDNYVVSFNLHDGAEMAIRKREAGWVQIDLPDRRRAWLKESQVETVS